MRHFALKILQFFSISLVVLMVLLFVFTIFGRFSWTQFFLGTALIALIAYVIIPHVRRTLNV